jgi:hypothetical protein
MKQTVNKAIDSLLQNAKRLPVSPRGSPFKLTISIIKNDETLQKRTIKVPPSQPYDSSSGCVRFRALLYT